MHPDSGDHMNIVDRLRALGFPGGDRVSLICNKGADEIERLRSIIATVDNLHSPRLAHDICVECNHDWPCLTQITLNLLEARRG